MDRKLRMGMVGGGRGAFIGNIHRIASQMDGLVELVAGAFSSDSERSKLSGKDWYLNPDRVYGTYEELIDSEKKRPQDERIDFISIVTPNHMHFPVAKLALENGFHVVCEKPMTFNQEEAQQLKEIVDQTGLRFALTHNYTGYPMVKQARHLVESGALGNIRKVVAEYPQGWLATLLEKSGQKQADWRTDPNRAGGSCCIGDIGTHAENLTEYITGLKITDVCAELTTFVEGRSLDDDGNILIKLEGGAKGIIHSSQISVGEENGLNIRVYGEKGALEWKQQEPNTLLFKHPNRPTEILRTNVGELNSAATFATRLPAGHPEGYLEAFANVYKNFALTLIHDKMGEQPQSEHLDFPRVEDGVRGMNFISAVLKSAQSDTKWTKL